MRTVIGTLAAVLALAPAALRAAEDDEAGQQLLQEAFVNELVYPQEKGEVQLTLAPQLWKSSERRLGTLPLTLEYGITSRWQVAAEWDSLLQQRPEGADPISGIGDLELATGYSFVGLGDGYWHATLGLGVGLPTGDVDKGLGEGRLEAEPFVLFARDLPRLGGSLLFGQVGVSFGKTVRGEEEDGDDDATVESTFGLGLAVPIRSLRLTAETVCYTGEQTELYAVPGIVARFGRGWEAGLGAPIGLNSHSDDFRVIGQVTFEFGGDRD